MVIKTRKHIILPMLLLSYLTSIFTLCQASNTVEQQFDVTLPKIETSVSRNKRMRKPKTKKKKEKKVVTYMDMEYQQLVAAKDAQKAKGNTTATIKYIEQLLKLSTDVTLIAEYLLELADAFFDDSQYQKSSLIYGQYCALYPGSAKQEYALYKSIASSFASMLPFDRDQSKTEETLTLTEAFLKQDHFSTHKDQVVEIQKQCYQQLAASECNVCTFYLDKGCFKAAEKRLARIRNFWLPKLPTLEPELIALETLFTEKKEMIQLLTLKNTELAQKKNEARQQLAENKKTRRMTERF
jgi:outer membrane assembly lipoprotein YfiO